MANKVLVTGAAGFIGSHLCEALLGKGISVYGMDCFTNYYPREIKEKNIAEAKNNKNFNFVEANLLNYDLSSLTKKVDTVFHLAAQPGVRYSWENFQIYLENNIYATQKLLEACKQSKPNFIFASSSSVYGDAPLPITEKTELEPISPYGLTKVACEKLCQLYAKQFSIPTTMLRYFTVYGPRQRPDMAVCKFFNSIFDGKEIEVYGNGEQTRDMTYVSDIVNATISAGDSKTDCGVFNIASGFNTSVNKIIKIISELAGKEAKLSYIEKQKGDMKDTLADISKAKKALGYSPETELKAGLEKYFMWFEKNK